MTENLTFHPISTIFPLMEGSPFTELVADIKASGLLEPIVLCDGQILDGRNRWRACQEADVPVRTITFDGTDPLAFVISQNLHRRHLNDGQRSMISARLANMSEGRPKKTPPYGGVSQSQAAKLLNVSIKSVERASAVYKHAVPELIKRAEHGDVAVSTAAKVATMQKAQQQ